MPQHASAAAPPKPEGLSNHPLEFAALGLLMMGPQHGYQLYQDFTREFRLIWKAGQAKFYAALSDMESRGRLTSHAEPQEGRPARKVYAITGAGRAAFLDWLHTPVAPVRAFRVEFLARLKFYRLLGLPDAAWLIDRQIHLLDRLLDEWRQPPDRTPDDSVDHFQDALNDFRQRQAQAMIDWLLAWRERFAEEEAVSA